MVFINRFKKIMNEYFLELDNINKTFGKITALKDICLKIGKNEIVGLIGDNGAGKSTLIKIISGLHPPDSGDIYVNGEKKRKWTSEMAHKAGIETVYQDKALSDQQPMYSNIFMGREICRFGSYIDIKKEKKEAQRLMNEMGFTSNFITPDSIVLNCSGGEREGIAITRAMYFQANLVILDEPMTALSILETKKVFNFILKIKEKTSSCILITHNIYHAYEVSDRFIVLDRGTIKEVVNKSNISCQDLIDKMSNIASEEKSV